MRNSDCGCNGSVHHPTDCLIGLAQTTEGRAELRRQIGYLRQSVAEGLTTPAIADAETARLKALLSRRPRPTGCTYAAAG